MVNSFPHDAWCPKKVSMMCDSYPPPPPATQWQYLVVAALRIPQFVQEPYPHPSIGDGLLK